MTYASGDAVRVRDDWPESRGPAHIRTPHYLRGHRGRIVRSLGAHPNPEDLAFARPAATRALYHVELPHGRIVARRERAGRTDCRTLRTLAGAVMTLIETDGERLLVAVRALLASKNLVTPAELAQRMEATDNASPGQGARMVARAWTDPAYRALMLEDGTRAAETLDIPMRGMPPLGVLENTAEVHNLIVCTLCSCYPRAVLGYPPFWYKSAAYRARAVRDPRGLLAEFRTTLPEDVKIHVVDSTADYRWMVLPQRPAGTDGWSVEQLAAIVREGDMVGSRFPSPSRNVAPPVAPSGTGGAQRRQACNTRCVWMPNPSTPNRMTSLGSRKIGSGFMPRATPGGVPVAMTSPGCSVMKWLT